MVERDQDAFKFWKEKDQLSSRLPPGDIDTSTPPDTLTSIPGHLPDAHVLRRFQVPKRPPPPRTSEHAINKRTSPLPNYKKPTTDLSYSYSGMSGSSNFTQSTSVRSGTKDFSEVKGTKVMELAKVVAPVFTSTRSGSSIGQTPSGNDMKGPGSLPKSQSSWRLPDTDTGSKPQRWGSFSSGTKTPTRTLSGKSKSGFTCYLDGPDTEPDQSRDTPSPPLPMSPLHEISDLVRVGNTPLADYFVPCNAQSFEKQEFWRSIERILGTSGDVNAKSYLLAPVITKPSVQPVTKRHGTVSMSTKSVSSLTLAIYSKSCDPPKTFQFSGTTLVQTVIIKISKQLSSGKRLDSTHGNWCLKVCGREEFLQSGLQLEEHEYVKQCQKLCVDVKLVLLDKSSMSVHQDDKQVPTAQRPTKNNVSYVSQEELNSLLNSYFAKEQKCRSVLQSHRKMTSSPVSLPALAQSVVSCVKLISERLSFIEPPDMIDAVYNLRRACKVATQLELEESTLFSPDESPIVSVPGTDPWISIPGGSYVITEEHVEDFLMALDVLKTSVQHLVTLYCTAYTPGYRPKWMKQSTTFDDVTCQQSYTFRVKVAALHRIRLQDVGKYSAMQVEVCVYYGGKALSKRAFSPHAKLSRDFFDCVVWDKWLNMGLELSCLPFESRALFTLYGIEMSTSGYQHNRVPVAWCSIRLFDSNRVLLSGSRVLGLWVGGEPNPVDSVYSDLLNRKSMILQVGFEEHATSLQFPQSLAHRCNTRRPAPPPNVTRTLVSIGDRDRFHSLSPDEQTLVWTNRMFSANILKKCPRGLPSVLMSSPSWHYPELGDIWAVVQEWQLADPTYGLELLEAQFPDAYVRAKAVEWLAQLSDDDLCDFLPQLVQSLRYDAYQTSAMAEFLLKRVLSSERVAHHLFWHLRLAITCDIKFKERYTAMLEGVELLCGSKLRLQLNTQVELVNNLRAVANAVKSSRLSQRQTTLIHGVRSVADKLLGPFTLPIDPAMVAKGISIEACSYFNSNTVPLKLSFTNIDPFGDDIDIIFKVGDDLRQDILILQMIKLMEKIWLRAGIDLRMITYQCVATGVNEGMLEMVTDASTLRTIQTEHGVTGSFKDKPLAEWLMRHNPTESTYKQAVENFTLSCAGYCVATFILGICDRHNDNIMVKKSGHLFHIDFGKILGNAQMLGNIKRDRAPFVLTRDMAYVINDGDRPTANFQKFTDLCCAAYNELRKYSSLLISLLSLMLSTGLPELSTTEDIQYVSDALLPRKTDAEATYAFTKYIEDSLGSLATPVNFFIHNLAQFKFSSSENTPALLSFCPQAYSIETDGKVTNLVVVAFHKRFYPDTHYVYQVEVYRDNTSIKSVIFRRYKEFDELQKKLVQCFPEDILPQLPRKIFTPGKSHTKETSERRQVDLNNYLCELLDMDRRVSESDVVYTFLHCLIRDEQDLGKLKEEEQGLPLSSIGKVKLEIAYKLKPQSLTVMVRHVKDLVPRDGFETADPYVKVYLLPDFNKSTKQKTKIAKRTLHPTYNQMSSLNTRSIQVSVWDASSIVNKQCLCVDTIKLSEYKSQLLQGVSVTDWFEMTPFLDTQLKST